MTVGKTFKYMAGLVLAVAPVLGLTLAMQKPDECKVSDLERKIESSVVQPVPEIEKPELRVTRDKNYLDNYSFKDYKNVQNALYGEAANQSRLGRKIVAKMILNRVDNPDYPNNIQGVIFEKNAFSCIKDKKNKNWEQAIGKLKRNAYEEMVYKRCLQDTQNVLNGERLGIPRENEIIAYHDVSVKYEDLVAKELELKRKWKEKGKRYDGYWMKLEPVHQEGRLIFYAPKNN